MSAESRFMFGAARTNLGEKVVSENEYLSAILAMSLDESYQRGAGT